MKKKFKKNNNKKKKTKKQKIKNYLKNKILKLIILLKEISNFM